MKLNFERIFQIYSGMWIISKFYRRSSVQLDMIIQRILRYIEFIMITNFIW